MTNHLVKALLLCIFFQLLGCVSVNFPESKILKSTEYSVVDPQYPFEKISSPGFDRSWRNKQLGTALGVLSECGVATENSLKDIQRDSFAAMRETEVVSSEEISKNETVGLRVTGKGYLNDKQVKISLALFRKEECNFIISFIGSPAGHDADLTSFNSFLEGFHLP
jgi:hypothetical protein